MANSFENSDFVSYQYSLEKHSKQIDVIRLAKIPSKIWRSFVCVFVLQLCKLVWTNFQINIENINSLRILLIKTCTNMNTTHAHALTHTHLPNRQYVCTWLVNSMGMAIIAKPFRKFSFSYSFAMKHALPSRIYVLLYFKILSQYFSHKIFILFSLFNRR